MNSNWDIVKLGNYIYEVHRKNKYHEDIDVFSVTNSLGFTKSTDYFSKKVFSKETSNYKIVYQGEFAYNPSRINVGSIDYLDGIERVIISPLYVVFKTKGELYNKYLKIFLKSSYGLIQIKNRTTGSVRDSLKYVGLETVKIPLPPLEDQIRIATILSCTETIITKRKESIRLLDELLKGIFLKMFGDPVRNDKGWIKKSIRENIGNVITGNTPPRKNKLFYNERFIEWVKTDNIFEDKMFITEAKEYLSKSGLESGRYINTGSLLVTCIAGSLKSIGTSALTNRRVAFNQQINAIVPFSKINPYFLYWLFRICKKYIQSYATKGMKKIIIKSEFEKIPMINPPLPLQKEFAKVVEKIESVRSKYELSLREYEKLYTALCQRAFRGELDLSRIPVDDDIKPDPAKQKRACSRSFNRQTIHQQ